MQGEGITTYNATRAYVDDIFLPWNLENQGALRCFFNPHQIRTADHLCEAIWIMEEFLAARMSKALELKSPEEWLRELDVFSFK